MNQQKVYLIAHNIRSAQNVGSLLRTADGLGVDRVYLTGYSPYPASLDKKRLPHIEAKISRRISKTALGAEDSVEWVQADDIFGLLDQLRSENFTLVGLEQTSRAKPAHLFTAAGNIALVVGREVEGIEPEVLAALDEHIEIPMKGSKESFNVSIAAAMALYLIKLKNDGHIAANKDKI